MSALEDGKAPKKKKGAGAYDYLTGLVEGIADGANGQIIIYY